MATKYRLTWRREQGGRWRKRYQGHDYYFATRDDETKAISYQRCWAAWLAKKANIDQQAEDDDPDSLAWQSLIKKLARKLTEFESKDTPENRQAWATWFAQLSTYRYMQQEKIPYPFLNDAERDDPESVPLVLGGGNILDDREPPPPWEIAADKPMVDESKTLQGNVAIFLKRKKLIVDRKQLSAGRYEMLRVGLDLFSSHCGVGFAIADVKSLVLSAYREKLEGMIDSGKLRPATAKDRLQVVKQFVRWAWEEELLDLPRVIESRGFAIAVPETIVETFSNEEVRRMLSAATEKTRLYLLLMLNCGMTQQDISDLRHDEVDWKNGRVNRKRSKTRTRNGEAVPTVDYKLWPKTFQLLKKHRSEHTELALTNEKVQPLKLEEIVGGKVRKIDSIRSAYKRLLKTIAHDKTAPVKIEKSLKYFRKTAASKLGAHSEHSRYAQYFLGHAPGNMADRHYVAPNVEQFDRAVTWLGQQFLG